MIRISGVAAPRVAAEALVQAFDSEKNKTGRSHKNVEPQQKTFLLPCRVGEEGFIAANFPYPQQGARWEDINFSVNWNFLNLSDSTVQPRRKAYTMLTG